MMGRGFADEIGKVLVALLVLGALGAVAVGVLIGVLVS